MSLRNVWFQTIGGGLIRADHVMGIDIHPTPAISGKPSRWLVDLVLPAPTGSGLGEDWTISPLHRTLTQVSDPPPDAPPALARLLAQLDAADATGIVTAVSGDAAARAGGGQAVQFRFTSFPIGDG